MPEIERVFAENFEVYGARKVWRQSRREGIDVIVRSLVEKLTQQGVKTSEIIEFASQIAWGAPAVSVDSAQTEIVEATSR